MLDGSSGKVLIYGPYFLSIYQKSQLFLTWTMFYQQSLQKWGCDISPPHPYILVTNNMKRKMTTSYLLFETRGEIWWQKYTLKMCTLFQHYYWHCKFDNSNFNGFVFKFLNLINESIFLFTSSNVILCWKTMFVLCWKTMLSKYSCIYRPYKQSISKEMDNDLKFA